MSCKVRGLCWTLSAPWRWWPVELLALGLVSWMYSDDGVLGSTEICWHEGQWTREEEMNHRLGHKERAFKVGLLGGRGSSGERRKVYLSRRADGWHIEHLTTELNHLSGNLTQSPGAGGSLEKQNVGQNKARRQQWDAKRSKNGLNESLEQWKRAVAACSGMVGEALPA